MIYDDAYGMESEHFHKNVARVRELFSEKKYQVNDCRIIKQPVLQYLDYINSNTAKHRSDIRLDAMRSIQLNQEQAEELLCLQQQLNELTQSSRAQMKQITKLELEYKLQKQKRQNLKSILDSDPSLRKAWNELSVMLKLHGHDHNLID